MGWESNQHGDTTYHVTVEDRPGFPGPFAEPTPEIRDAVREAVAEHYHPEHTDRWYCDHLQQQGVDCTREQVRGALRELGYL